MSRAKIRIGESTAKGTTKAAKELSARDNKRPKHSEDVTTLRYRSRPICYGFYENELTKSIALALSMCAAPRAGSPSGWTFAGAALSGCFNILAQYFGTQMPQWTGTAMLCATTLAFIAALVVFWRERAQTKIKTDAALRLLEILQAVRDDSNCERSLAPE